MPIKKWLLQYTAAFVVLFPLLGGVQYLKGMPIDGAIGFGLFWSVLSIGIFAAKRFHNYKKYPACHVNKGKG